MGVDFKSLPWKPQGSERRVIGFTAAGFLCTHCAVALHQESMTTLEYHRDLGIEPEITRAEDGTLSGIAGGIWWRMSAEGVHGTETHGEHCMMCNSDCRQHSVPDVETHGHYVVMRILTTPMLPVPYTPKG